MKRNQKANPLLTIQNEKASTPHQSCSIHPRPSSNLLNSYIISVKVSRRGLIDENQSFCFILRIPHWDSYRFIQHQNFPLAIHQRTSQPAPPLLLLNTLGGPREGRIQDCRLPQRGHSLGPEEKQDGDELRQAEPYFSLLLSERHS